MESVVLLNRIIERGGLIGKCARMYVADEDKAAQFIKECTEQCHNKSAKELWGEQLIADILDHTTLQVKEHLEHVE